MRHMYQYGTTSEQLAWVKVAASHHAQHNPNAMLRNVVTVEEVLNSPMISDPLHRLDCCVVSDGGGGVIVTRPEIAKSLKRPVLSGWSMGGRVIRRYLMHAGDSRLAGVNFVGALAIEDPSCRGTHGPKSPPLGQPLPEEIAAAAHYLASDEAALVTGTSLLADGGWSVGK